MSKAARVENRDATSFNPVQNRRANSLLQHNSERSIRPLVGGMNSSGQSLDAETREFMEPRFGHDFSQVRVHQDAPAAESARSANALAYAMGDNIVFGAGKYEPGTNRGRRLLAHELAHVAQQRRGPGANNDAESRARNAASKVSEGGFIEPELIGQAPLGVYADDGTQTTSEESKGGSFKSAGPPLSGHLQVSSWLVQELIKQGQLSPQLLQLIQSGQIEIKPDEKSGGIKTGGAKPIGDKTESGSKKFSLEFNALPYRFLGSTTGISGSDSGAKTAPVSPPTPQWVLTGGYTDPVIGYIPRHFVKWTPPSPSAPQPAGEPNWLQKSLADLKTSFSFSEGLTISSISNPGVSTSIFVTGVTQRAKIKGLGVQTELGWDKSIGLQLSYRDWYLHGTLDADGKWGLTLSFPNDSPVPITPWINDIFRQGGVAIAGFAKAAAAGPPNLNNLDPLIKEVSPHVDRMKGAIDAAKGIAKAQPGINVALTVGSGPRPGAEPAEKPSGIFIGGAIVGSF